MVFGETTDNMFGQWKCLASANDLIVDDCASFFNRVTKY